MTIGKLIKGSNDMVEIAMCVLNMDRTDLILNSDRELSPEEFLSIDSLLKKRQAGAPLAYVTNRRGFYKHVFHVNEDVLIPQPDTETLVEKAVEILLSNTSEELSVLDLCAGSGCIGISVADELAKCGKKINLTLSDISKGACDVFSRNADKLLEQSVKVNKVNASLFEGLSQMKFDCILTNPPYIKTSVIDTLSDEVKAEPLLALDGGTDGLDLIRSIARQSSGYLKKEGFLLCEIGFDQGKEAMKIFGDFYPNVEIFKDLGSNDRVVKAFF